MRPDKSVRPTVTGDIADILAKVERGERLDFDDGVRLFRSNDLNAIGWGANLVRRRLNGRRTYYVVNAHINYTDVCANRCAFCAFSRDERDPDSYLMTVEEIVARAREICDRVRFTELHIVGGLHPKLGLDYYTRMLRALSNEFPGVHLQAFTAVEIEHIARKAGISVEDCLGELKEAGLGSLPGGGAEIFAKRVRDILCPDKLSAEGWLDVMRTAHRLGIRSNATMLYGHVETHEERVDHILRIRELQDETGGFLSFIALRYHPERTRLEGVEPPLRGVEDLKTVAISRLLLDNLQHIKVFWIMFGLKLAQVALSFGADDFDGTVVEEKITHRAGAETPEGLSVSRIQALITATGTEPVERNTLYEEITRDSSGIPAVSERQAPRLHV